MFVMMERVYNRFTSMFPDLEVLSHRERFSLRGTSVPEPCYSARIIVAKGHVSSMTVNNVLNYYVMFACHSFMYFYEVFSQISAFSNASLFNLHIMQTEFW